MIDTKQMLLDAQRAFDAVGELCQGTRKWTMCVPPQPDDQDMVFTKALCHIKTLADGLSALRAKFDNSLVLERHSGDESPTEIGWYLCRVDNIPSPRSIIRELKFQGEYWATCGWTVLEWYTEEGRYLDGEIISVEPPWVVVKYIDPETGRAYTVREKPLEVKP